ncbi:MAG: ArsR/SmtB family transcription factor [Gemmatimonadota bacterium]
MAFDSGDRMLPLARRFKALSEDARLRILALMFRHGELCGCEVEQLLGISQSSASRHLRYLLNAGLVEDTRDGLWVYYRLASPGDEEQRAFLEALRGLLAGVRIPDAGGDLASMRAVRCHPAKARDPGEECCPAEAGP